MKQIPMTPQIEAWLKTALGPDVENIETYAVFESISLNTQPLPGKRGTIFEGSVVPPTTLLAMVNYINGDGGSLPLMIDHNMDGAPKGRIFHAGLTPSDEGVEFRTLFYIDPTETALIAKVNNGTYDEVSVQFLAEKILCSECGWDYRGSDASWSNLLELTCDNNHHIGEDGVHTRLVGLESFVEISLVARGAAEKPKIVGKSASKLATATVERLAAQGFKDLDALIVRASLGENDVNIDVNKLVADLSDVKAELKTSTASIATLTARAEKAETDLAAAQTQLGERDSTIADLNTQLDAAKGATRADEADAAITYLKDVLTGVRTASGKEVGDLPETVADLTAAIDAETSKLTAILPVNGVSQPAGSDDDRAEKRDFSAFRLNPVAA